MERLENLQAMSLGWENIQREPHVLSGRLRQSDHISFFSDLFQRSFEKLFWHSLPVAIGKSFLRSTPNLCFCNLAIRTAPKSDFAKTKVSLDPVNMKSATLRLVNI